MDFTCCLSFLSFLLPLAALFCFVRLDVVSDQVLWYSWGWVWWIKFIAYGNGNFITALWISWVRWVQTLQEFTGPGKNPWRSKSGQIYLYFQTCHPFFESDPLQPLRWCRAAPNSSDTRWLAEKWRKLSLLQAAARQALTHEGFFIFPILYALLTQAPL